MQPNELLPQCVRYPAGAKGAFIQGDRVVASYVWDGEQWNFDQGEADPIEGEAILRIRHTDTTSPNLEIPLDVPT